MSVIYLGVDPGYSGALAFYGPVRDELAIYDMPVFKLAKVRGGTKTVVDLLHLAAIIDENVKDRKVIAFIEAVGARPGEAPQGAFNFGFGAGVLHGVCAAHFLRIENVSPQRWKRALGVPADKDGARYRAAQLLPQHARHWPLKKHDGRAEAALLALYGSKHDAG